MQALEGEQADLDLWMGVLASVLKGLENGKRLLVEDAARKVNMLLVSKAATDKENIIQVTWI